MIQKETYLESLTILMTVFDSDKPIPELILYFNQIVDCYEIEYSVVINCRIINLQTRQETFNKIYQLIQNN